MRYSNDAILHRISSDESSQTQNEEKLKSYNEAAKRDRAMLKARSDSVTQLKVIVFTMFGTIFFNLIYSVMVMFMYTPVTCL